MAARSGYERGRAISAARAYDYESACLVGMGLGGLGMVALLRWMKETFSDDVQTLLCLGLVAAGIFIAWLIELHDRRYRQSEHSPDQDLIPPPR
jgi:hypothetical protein